MTAICHWKEDFDGNYDTDCGESFTLIAGKLKENRMIYCCYCGKTIAEVPYTDLLLEEDC